MPYFPTSLLAFGVVFTLQAQAFDPPVLASQKASQPSTTATTPPDKDVYHLTGRVFTPLGQPLPGATLAVSGTAIMVITDAKGRFALELPSKTTSTLIAGYAGYEDQTLLVWPNQPPLSVNMRPVPVSRTSTAQALHAGDLAPDFELPTTTGTKFKLSEHRGHPVVLYFYPKDGSPGCTKEACSFRDQYKEFTDLGAEVIGISSDSEASHQQFAEKYQLPFTLLSDADGQLRKKYAVPRAALGLIPGRVTYVLDGEGRVRYVFSSLTGANDHVHNAKDILYDLH